MSTTRTALSAVVPVPVTSTESPALTSAMEAADRGSAALAAVFDAGVFEVSIRAADSTTQTYLVDTRTKVFTRAARADTSKTPASKAPGSQAAARPALPRTAASIADVKAGDSVLVAGTGTTALSAVRVVDIKK